MTVEVEAVAQPWRLCARCTRRLPATAFHQRHMGGVWPHDLCATCYTAVKTAARVAEGEALADD